LPRLYREAPVNAIWEGSGNVMCLDVLRALGHEREAAQALLDGLATATAGLPGCDEAVAYLRCAMADPQAESHARGLVERLALLARVTSAAISSRSTAAVDSRSSHSAIGSSVRRARLRAKARVDCARGPSLPSMLTGSPSTNPVAFRSVASASRRAASAEKFL